MDLEQYEVMFQQEDHHWWYRGMREITGALLERWYQGPRPAAILDAGCGTGGMVQWLGRYGHVAGVDIAEAALSRATTRGLQALTRGSVDALPFQDGSFDLVTSFDVLYHLEVKSDLQALEEIHRVLRPGGVLLIRVPAHDWLRAARCVGAHPPPLRTARASAEATSNGVSRAAHHLRQLDPLPACTGQADARARRSRWRAGPVAASRAYEHGPRDVTWVGASGGQVNHDPVGFIPDRRCATVSTKSPLGTPERANGEAAIAIERRREKLPARRPLMGSRRETPPRAWSQQARLASRWGWPPEAFAPQAVSTIELASPIATASRLIFVRIIPSTFCRRELLRSFMPS